MSLIVHVTTVHPRFDVRIFHKECLSLAAAGCTVTLVVADGLGSECCDGVNIIDVGRIAGGRLNRMIRQPSVVVARVISLNPAVVHLHDPELLVVARRFLKRGIKVVYDAHEDLPRQILSKHWLPAPLRPVISRVIEVYENYIARSVTAVVAATPHIAARFSALGARTVFVGNFPSSSEFSAIDADKAPVRERSICYVGAIARSRGIGPLVDAMASLPNVKLVLCGRFEDGALESELRKRSGWAQVEYRGILDRAGVAQVLRTTSVGMVTLLPTPSYLDSLPIKLFEYMSAGLPVIASDFPMWRTIVADIGAGLHVDPTDPAAISRAIVALLDDKEAAAEMGRRGRAAVEGTFNWAVEEGKLLAMYAELSDDQAEHA